MCRSVWLVAGLLMISGVTIGCGKGSIKPDLVEMYQKHQNDLAGADEIKKSIEQGFNEFDKDETESINELNQVEPLKKMLVLQSDAESSPEECRKRLESNKPFPFRGREEDLGVLEILSAAGKGELTEDQLVLGPYDSRRDVEDGWYEKGIGTISKHLANVRYAMFTKTTVKKCPKLMPNPDYDSKSVVKELNMSLSPKYLFDPGLGVLVVAIWDINEKKFIYRRSVEVSAGYAVSADGLSGSDAFKKLERELLESMEESAETEEDKILKEAFPDLEITGYPLPGTNGGGMNFLTE